MFIFLFILGTIIGSFLNVCIVRLPREKSVVRPASHCPHCQTPILWLDNIPLLSFLILRGRCRFCHQKISARYFIVELVTGLSFAAFFYCFGFSVYLIPYLVMTAGFIVAAFVDLELRIIPDEVSLGGIWAGLIFSFLIPQLHGIIPAEHPWGFGHVLGLGWSMAGVLAGGGAIYAMGLLGDFLFKKESMGGGDVKLMGMVGAFLGWKLAILSFFIAPFFGAVFGIIEKIRTKDTTIAYGPFLVLGALISLFWGDWLIEWILTGYGLF